VSRIRRRRPPDGRKRRRGMPAQVLQVVYELQQTGNLPHQIAPVLAERFGYPALPAMRLAHGWSQGDAAQAWNDRWPNELKTFKNFSYWETWFDGSSRGYAADLPTLHRLAQLYQCAVADLLAGYGEHRPDSPTSATGTGEPVQPATPPASTHQPARSPTGQHPSGRPLHCPHIVSRSDQAPRRGSRTCPHAGNPSTV